jgi:hypothetical protein
MSEYDERPKVTRDTVERMFARMTAAYQGRIESSDSVLETWFLLLRDLDAEATLKATMDILSEPREWPPTPGQVRDRAVDISRGKLVPISPTEAWEHVLNSSVDSSVILDENEKRALRVCGGAWAVKTSSHVESVRMTFIAHYKALCVAEKRIAATIPEVARFSRVHHELPATTKEMDSLPRPSAGEKINRGTSDEVRELLKGYRFMDENGNPVVLKNGPLCP